MSALHRLKAYFGMVPAEDFDAVPYDDRVPFNDAARFDTAEREGYHSSYPSGYPASEPLAHRRSPRAAEENHDDGFPPPARQHAPMRHPAASKAQAVRSSSSVMEARGRSSRPPWAADAAVRGSLAIDPAAADPASIDTGRIDSGRIEPRPPTRQPFLPQPFAHEPQADLLVDHEGHPLSRIVTLHPHSYNEARPIGERYREGNPVIMNLTAMEDRDAKRLVDFAAGLAFALRGSIDKVTNKVFLLSPPNVEVSAEDRRRIAEGRLFT